MATSTANASTMFSAPVGDDELSLDLDRERGQLIIELANASRFVVHRKVIIKQEEIREYTGK